MTARISPAGFRVALLSLLVAGSAAGSGYDLSVPVRTGDRIDGHYVWSVEGLGPDSLTDAGEIAFIDLYVDQIPSQGALSSLRRGADVGDLIGGVAVSEFKAGFQAAIDGNGTIGFQALSQGLGDLVFVLPGFALPNLAAQVGAATTTAGSHPAANELGDTAFAFNWCNEANCPRRWIGEPAGALLADEFMQDGFQITDFDVPALN